MTVKNLPEETRRKLKVRAARHGRSTDATRSKVGTELAAFGRKYGGIELDINRDNTEAKLPSFE